MNLALKETSGELDVRLIASINAWQFIEEYPFKDNSPHQIQWKYGNDTVVVFVEDFLLELNYLVVQGSDEEIVKQQVVNGLEIYTEADIFRLNSEDFDSRTAGILIKVASLIAPKVFDQGFFELFLKTFNFKDTDVQRTAVFAVNYIPWIQFRAALLNIKNIYPELSKDIDVVVQANDTHGWI